ncbi:MAG: DNA polymerase III subunit epsilon [Gammaproteobacteria bacterium]|nr:DNA polymerase III subunit epsilon [Gammaproteobacteria bacterium]
MRQVVLDTETTGLEVGQGHRVIEIGCVELVNRRRTSRTFHRYVHPDREIDAAAEQVHGITNEMLHDKPRFAEIATELLEFVEGAELVIHNADFDLGFLARELELAGLAGDRLRGGCRVVDTLALARRLHPGQRNGLDALCRRYNVDNSGRDFHGALLDAQLLADVYLAMTGGQAALSLETAPAGPVAHNTGRLDRRGLELVVVPASAEELVAHERQLDLLARNCPQGALWRQLPE